MKRPILSLGIAAASLALALPTASAQRQLQDAPEVDSKMVIEIVTKLRQQQEASIKQRITNAFEMVKAATASGEKAANLWKEAVKSVQFAGADDQAAKLRAWRDNEGDALNSREAQNAARLHVTWLFYTLQYHAGVPKKDLVPLVIDYTNQLAANGQTMESFEENMQKQREREQSGKHGSRRSNDSTVKRMHDTILNTSVTSSPIAKYLGIDIVLPKGSGTNDRLARQVAQILGNGKGPKSADDSWPTTPGDLEAIHRAIILPEYRATKDSRILDYWDRVIQRETQNVAKNSNDYDQKRFAEIRRPELLWSRAQDLMAIGLKNRAINEMLAIVRANPLHPRLDEWLMQLENAIRPPAPVPSTPPEADPAETSAN